MPSLQGSPSWFREKAAEIKYKDTLAKMDIYRKEFLSKYSPDKLTKMSGEELLIKVFGNGGTMLDDLMIDTEKYRQFGAPGGYKYNRLVYYSNEGTWKYKSGQYSYAITREEACKRAVEIRDKLIKATDAVQEAEKLDTLADYRMLEGKLRSVYFYKYTWVLKYFHMLDPERFPAIYDRYFLSRTVDILGLPNQGDQFLNLAEIGLFVQKCEINSTIMMHIVGATWGWKDEKPPCSAAASNYKEAKMSVSSYRKMYGGNGNGITETEAKGILESVNKEGLTGEEKEIITKARINQSKFREMLLKKYSKCCLCSVSNPDLLVASHIKPWSVSTPKEKVDINNGLLLCPNHDKLFDKGFITFTEEGEIVISNKLNMVDRVYMNVKDGMRVDLTEAGKQYIKYHRENEFKQ